MGYLGGSDEHMRRVKKQKSFDWLCQPLRLSEYRAELCKANDRGDSHDLLGDGLWTGTATKFSQSSWVDSVCKVEISLI